jgi:hypothetical protein
LLKYLPRTFIEDEEFKAIVKTLSITNYSTHIELLPPQRGISTETTSFTANPPTMLAPIPPRLTSLVRPKEIGIRQIGSR